MAAVKSLGYLIIDAIDLDAWVAFGADLAGMQVTVRTDERLEFRTDEKEYRFIINKADANRARIIGWEVGGPADLKELVARLEGAGYAVTRHSREEARERRVTELASFTDPDGELTIELHYGLREANERFVSPNGVTFTNRARNGQTMGLGHVLQSVNNLEKFEELYFDIFGFGLSDHSEAGPEGAKFDLIFAHCNPRQHSFAFTKFPGGVAPLGINHFMLELDDLDMVGRAYDKVTEGKAAPLLSTLGKHTNDKMVSFYMRNPSGFGVEYGTGGMQIDPAIWTPARFSEAHYWGHQRATQMAPNDPAKHD